MKKKMIEFWYTNNVKMFYIIIQSNLFISIIFKVMSIKIKHFYWFGNIIRDTVSILKLNPK